MYQLTSDNWTNETSQRFRERVAAMPDETLRRTLEAGHYMASPRASWGPPRECYIIQEAIAEQEMERRAIQAE